MDLKRENLEKQLREEKPKQMELESAFKSVKEKQEIQKELLAKFESKRNMTEQKIVQKEEEISRKIGTEKEPEAYLKQQEKRLSELRKKYQTAKEQKEQAEMQMRICEDDRNSLEGQIKGNREALFQANEKLCSEMEKQQFSGREEVEYALLEEEVFQRYTEMIETYKKQLHEAEVQLSEIQKKRNRRSITEEKYIECNGICADLEKKTEEQKEKQLEIRQEIRIIRENLDLQKKIVEKLEEVEHKIAILKDLQGVTKGKRFVEFMAVERLKYISKSASKRLFEITNGNYELELNGEGEFVIRDNKNGGVLRQTATLSGGETFVTSLALALALSTEIQLKGTAPLELFFLDEGFGSLDETLLDIVMGSLEKIHNERLKVGIISHVEAVKSRVPVRLIVSPAETGVGGSKVKIEYA